MRDSRMESEERHRHEEEVDERDRSRQRNLSFERSELNCEDERHRRSAASSGRRSASVDRHRRDRNEGRGGNSGGGDRQSESKSRNSIRERDGGRGEVLTTLYVTSVPPRANVSDVRHVFEEIGEVQDCKIVNNPVTRESRGFAFVSFVDPNKASIAIERLDGKAYIAGASRPIKVELAKRNMPHNPTPGYYKGPAAASIKYDKSGHLKPGFLPYYAVSPGASRDVMPPHGAFPLDYYGAGPRFGRMQMGRWPDERECSRGGYETGGRGFDRHEFCNPHARGAPYDMRLMNGGDIGYGMRMERGYGGRCYDARGVAYDPRSGMAERESSAYGVRGSDRVPYDGRMRPDDIKGDSRYGGYHDYYSGSGPSAAATHDYGNHGTRMECRDSKHGSLRARSRSRGRRERRRSSSRQPRSTRR